MEILTIAVSIEETVSVAGSTGEVKMITFTGEAAGSVFQGQILPGGVDTQTVKNGLLSLSARYMLEGKDFEGHSCRIYIENNGSVTPGAPLKTIPKLVTDSKALRWLETATLSAIVEPLNAQNVLIHIFSM